MQPLRTILPGLQAPEVVMVRSVRILTPVHEIDRSAIDTFTNDRRIAMRGAVGRRRYPYPELLQATDAKKLNKDEILTSVAIIILLFTSIINWNIYSWLILLAIIVILAAWYLKKQQWAKRDRSMESLS